MSLLSFYTISEHFNSALDLVSFISVQLSRELSVKQFNFSIAFVSISDVKRRLRAKCDAMK